jgi:hypothetical protein
MLMAVLLLLIGFVAGTLRPRVQALDPTERLVRELSGIRAELTQIRRALERR